MYGAPVGAQYANVAVSEAMEDIAQVERLVGRLAQCQPGYAPSGQGAPRSIYGVSYGGAAESPAMAAEVVARMVENISQDSRLLPPCSRRCKTWNPPSASWYATTHASSAMVNILRAACSMS